MITKRALLDTAADQRLLVLDRSRRLAVETALQSRNTLLVGESGSGKTTLLYHIRAKASEAPDGRARAVYVDARRAETPRLLADKIIASAVEAEWIPPAATPAPDDPFGLEAQLARLAACPQGSMVLLDDPDEAQARILFGRMRDVLLQLDGAVWFTVAVTPEVQKKALSRPPANVFFDTTIELLPFGPDDTFEMLRRRKDRGEIDQIIDSSQPLQPRVILLDAEAGPSGIRHDAELQHELLTRAQKAAGRAGAMVFSEIWSRGAASGSDESLLSTIGVTRTRLGKILRALAAEGVLTVVSPPESESRGQGRPKIYYDINRAP